jgi:hypothetical protein
VVELAWSSDPDNYASSSVANNRVFHAGQVKDDDPVEKRYPGPSGWGLGVRPTTSSGKKISCGENLNDASDGNDT